MIEIRIHGRGGQGGVTLAKIIATLHFLEGRSAQAFGLYAAERSGAPIQAFVRIDEEEITNRNQVYTPDVVIVIDPALLGDAVVTGLKPGGWMIVNTAESPAALGERFPGYRVATVNATAIAAAHGLGTRSVPIVNTTLAGAFARVFDFDLDAVARAFAEMRFPPGNLEAAREALEQTEIGGNPERPVQKAAVTNGRAPVPGLLSGKAGRRPAVHTSAWATQRPVHGTGSPPCNCVCPAGNDVRGFLAALAADKVDEALAVLHETSPLPGVCGRVCPAPCVENCNRQYFDSSVNVRELERFAAEFGRHEPLAEAARGERVAVIGSGPAGLSAAYQLARLGYGVELFEAGADLGGVLRTGIPPYRLPRKVLDQEIGMILGLGVRARTGHRVTRGGLVDLSRRFAATYVATGLQEIRTLNIGNLHPERVMEGIDFLDRANRRELSLEGYRVVVVGGGNTAIDAARTALRLGAQSVRIAYRRTRDEMPAIREEIDEAVEEGIEIDCLVSPVELAGKDGRYVLTCVRNRSGARDESGRRRAEPIEGSEFDMACDRLILALGQTGDLSLLPEGAQVSEQGRVVGTLESPVYVGGDLATGEGTVAAAIGNGRRTALQMHRLLSGEDLLPAAPGEPVRFESLNTNYFRRAARSEGAAAAPQTRRHTFDEVRGGLTDAREAQRCLSCGVCNTCAVCANLCPEGSIYREGDRYVFNYDHCKGCGVCAAECPRHVILMGQI